jgi:hypothetical protein
MAERPLWKAIEGELWWRGGLVKQYRSDAAQQRYVLDAFQSRGWIASIDNPLPHQEGLNRKTALQYTIKRLNRGQSPLRIRFCGDGRGGIRWKAIV